MIWLKRLLYRLFPRLRPPYIERQWTQEEISRFADRPALKFNMIMPVKWMTANEIKKIYHKSNAKIR